jgi:hypothetical protein
MLSSTRLKGHRELDSANKVELPLPVKREYLLGEIWVDTRTTRLIDFSFSASLYSLYLIIEDERLELVTLSIAKIFF